MVATPWVDMTAVSHQGGCRAQLHKMGGCTIHNLNSDDPFEDYGTVKTVPATSAVLTAIALHSHMVVCNNRRMQVISISPSASSITLDFPVEASKLKYKILIIIHTSKYVIIET